MPTTIALVQVGANILALIVQVDVNVTALVQVDVNVIALVEVVVVVFVVDL